MQLFFSNKALEWFTEYVHITYISRNSLFVLPVDFIRTVLYKETLVM